MTEAEEISTAAATLRRTRTLPADAAEPLAHLLATEAQWAERCGDSYTKGNDSAAASARDVVAIARAVNSARKAGVLFTESERESFLAGLDIFDVKVFAEFVLNDHPAVFDDAAAKVKRTHEELADSMADISRTDDQPGGSR